MVSRPAHGFINSRMMIAQAAKFTQMENPDRRALTFGVLQRLGALTAIALLIAFAFRPQGFTVLIGLAVFQLLMMGAAAGAMVRQSRGLAITSSPPRTSKSACTGP